MTLMSRCSSGPTRFWQEENLRLDPAFLLECEGLTYSGSELAAGSAWVCQRRPLSFYSSSGEMLHPLLPQRHSKAQLVLSRNGHMISCWAKL